MSSTLLRILLVDDDGDDFVMTRALLSECPGIRCQLDWAPSFEEGIAALERSLYDLFLCDYRLGAHTGLEFIEQIRRRKIFQPIILLTGQGDASVDIAAMQAGADDYLVKSALDAQTLERAIRYAIQHYRSAQALREQLARISLLNLIARSIAERLEMRSIFLAAVTHLEDRLHVDLAGVYAIKPEQRQFELFVLGPRTRALARQNGVEEGFLVPIDETNLQPCLDGKIVYVAHLEKVGSPHAQVLVGVGMRSAVALPFSANGNVFGILRVFRRQPDGFPESEREFLRAVCEHISLAARHAKLHEELQQAYQQLQKNQKEMMEKERLAAVGQLAAGVAHEFNNILTVIQGYSSLLVTMPDVPARLTGALNNINKSTVRAARLVNQLLAFGRKQIIQPKPLDLNDVVLKACGMLGQSVEEHIEIRAKYFPQLPLVNADPGSMEQIVINLALNSRDAMPNGGRIEIELGVENLDAAAARRNPDARPGQFVCLTVRDTGCGMDESTLARIFEPFFTTKEVGKGTGLGLSVVYGIVKQHQGWIEVQSRPNAGTTMRVFIPAIPQTVGGAVPEPVGATAIRGGSETILVVEDEPILLGMIKLVLENLGYRVIAASNGAEAIELWRTQKDNVELLLTDLVMPGGISGKELAELLRAEKPGLKVIYSSGYSMDMSGRELVEAAGSRFLSKPYDPARLGEVVRECLDAKV